MSEEDTLSNLLRLVDRLREENRALRTDLGKAAASYAKYKEKYLNLEKAIEIERKNVSRDADQISALTTHLHDISREREQELAAAIEENKNFYNANESLKKEKEQLQLKIKNLETKEAEIKLQYTKQIAEIRSENSTRIEELQQRILTAQSEADSNQEKLRESNKRIRDLEAKIADLCKAVEVKNETVNSSEDMKFLMQQNEILEDSVGKLLYTVNILCAGQKNYPLIIKRLQRLFDRKKIACVFLDSGKTTLGLIAGPSEGQTDILKSVGRAASSAIKETTDYVNNIRNPIDTLASTVLNGMSVKIHPKLIKCLRAEGDWIPAKAFEYMTLFGIRNNLDMSQCKELLIALSATFKQAEDINSEAILIEHKNEISRLKRMLQNKIPYDAVRAEDTITRLKNEVSKLRKQLFNAVSIANEREKQLSNAPGYTIDVIDEDSTITVIDTTRNNENNNQLPIISTKRSLSENSGKKVTYADLMKSSKRPPTKEINVAIGKTVINDAKNENARELSELKSEIADLRKLFQRSITASMINDSITGSRITTNGTHNINPSEVKGVDLAFTNMNSSVESSLSLVSNKNKAPNENDIKPEIKQLTELIVMSGGKLSIPPAGSMNFVPYVAGAVSLSRIFIQEVESAIEKTKDATSIKEIRAILSKLSHRLREIMGKLLNAADLNATIYSENIGLQPNDINDEERSYSSSTENNEEYNEDSLNTSDNEEELQKNRSLVPKKALLDEDYIKTYKHNQQKRKPIRSIERNYHKDEVMDSVMDILKHTKKIKKITDTSKND